MQVYWSPTLLSKCEIKIYNHKIIKAKTDTQKKKKIIFSADIIVNLWRVDLLQKFKCSIIMIKPIFLSL